MYYLKRNENYKTVAIFNSGATNMYILVSFFFANLIKIVIICKINELKARTVLRSNTDISRYP